MKIGLPEGNLRSVLRNLPYLFITKVLLLFLIAVLTFGVGTQFFECCRLYTEDRDGVRNAFTQGENFDLRTSEPFATEMGTAVNALLRYALVYQDIDGFAAADLLRVQLAQEEKNRDSQISATAAICEWQVQSGKIEQEKIDSGFIVQTSGGAYVDQDAIRAHYTAVYDALVEGEKRSMDREYRELMNAIEEMRGVYYAVMDYDANRLVTNTGCTKRSELQRFFSGTKNNLIVFNADDPVFPADTMEEFVPLVQAAGEQYEQPFDFYLSLNGGLDFNTAASQMENRCLSLYRQVHALLLRGVILGAIMLLLCVLMLLVTGRREYKGAIKYCATDRLPNEIHLTFHGVIASSMIVLFQNSVQIVLLTKADDLWFPSFPEYYAIRGEVCLVILVLTALAAVCTFKRQYKNKSVFSNTTLALLMRQFKKKEDAPNNG